MLGIRRFWLLDAPSQFKRGWDVQNEADEAVWHHGTSGVAIEVSFNALEALDHHLLPSNNLVDIQPSESISVFDQHDDAVLQRALGRDSKRVIEAKERDALATNIEQESAMLDV